MRSLMSATDGGHAGTTTRARRNARALAYNLIPVEDVGHEVDPIVRVRQVPRPFVFQVVEFVSVVDEEHDCGVLDSAPGVPVVILSLVNEAFDSDASRVLLQRRVRWNKGPADAGLVAGIAEHACPVELPHW
jgi:hypothetical protein